jgi:hypothetical protein
MTRNRVLPADKDPKPRSWVYVGLANSAITLMRMHASARLGGTEESTSLMVSTIPMWTGWCESEQQIKAVAELCTEIQSKRSLFVITKVNTELLDDYT